ncbi:MAG: ATP synthase subunit I [Deltaproteobacteria bacterium]|nr:ATP synthase subunit I [Deltaproteobacteria bacterium]
MKEEIIRDIERLNILILAIGSLTILFTFRDFNYFLSFAIGSALMTLNFRVLRAIVSKGFLGDKNEKKGFFIKLPLKFLGLLSAVSVIVIFGDIHVIYFLLGISTVFISIVFSQMPFIKILCAGGKEKNGT